MASIRVLEPARATFSYTILGLAPAATPTDVLALQGFNGGIVQLRRVWLSGLATAAEQVSVSLFKRAGANTGGTSTSPKAVQGDRDGNARAKLLQYSANPTALSSGMLLRSSRLLLNAAAAAPDRLEFTFGEGGGKTPRLNLAEEFFTINLNGGAWPAGGKLDIMLEWTEQ